ncbi:Imm50 family immunity protein [Clostridium tertium]|uniref:Imm50 family immunity protein n=1 Tax=Clostridium tertium TaxID=1559 RepID=UPI001AEB6C8F|nr:Imm50 family immunity protein [Clostridium tertium]MBP1866674.1 hypothetical protein [Clostridium tertium]
MKEIKGYKEIEQLFGYFPTFHDDIIEKIEICNDKLFMIIRMETKPKTISSVVRIEFTLENVFEIRLEGNGYLTESIIFEIEIKAYDFYTQIIVDSSTGLIGNIKAEKVKIKALY